MDALMCDDIANRIFATIKAVLLNNTKTNQMK